MDAGSAQYHRNGHDYELPLPEVAIPPRQISMDAAIALRRTLAQDSETERALFDAVMKLLI